MAAGIGQSGFAGAGALGNPTTVREGTEVLLEERWGKMTTDLYRGDMEKLEQGLAEAETIGTKVLLLDKYRGVLSEYSSLGLTLDDDQCETLVRLEARFRNEVWKMGHEDKSPEQLEKILSEAKEQGSWVKGFLLSKYTKIYPYVDHPERNYEALLRLILNEIKGYIQENPTKFELDYIIWDLSEKSSPSSAELSRLAGSLQIKFQKMPKTVDTIYFCQDLFVDEIDGYPSRYPSVVTDYHYFLERRCQAGDLLEVRDQAELDRFQRIFNRIDFVLAWEEKATSRSGVGILPKELVQKIAKCLTWPQVVWELRDDEKVFDAKENPIYRRALHDRQIANETAKRILGSAKRPSEGRVEELDDDEPLQKRARIGEI